MLNGKSSGNQMRKQQGGGGVIFWAGLRGNTIVSPFRVEQGVKLNSRNYCSFLTRNCMPWYQRLLDQDKRTLILMKDSAPSHASKYSRAWFSDNDFGGSKLMTWAPNSPDLNPIEILWSLIKRKVYGNGKQYSSVDALDVLLEAVRKASTEVPEKRLSCFVNNVDKSLVNVIKCHGGSFERVK